MSKAVGKAPFPGSGGQWVTQGGIGCQIQLQGWDEKDRPGVLWKPGSGQEAAVMLSQQLPPPSSTPVLHGASIPVLGPPRGHGHGGAGYNQQTLEKPALKQAQGAASCQTARAPAPVGCNTAGQSEATSLCKPHCPGKGSPGRALPSVGVLMCHPAAPVSGCWGSLQPDPALGRLL